MRRLGLVLAVTALCVSTGVALAAAGYNLRVTAPHRVGRGKAFTVIGSGSAKKRVHLVFFVSLQKCADSYVIEFNEIGAWQLGDPYFRRGHGRGSKSLFSKAYDVHGSFKVSATAHAGSHAGTEYVCAYLPSSNPSVTRAHASTTYRVRR
jgi:hypothetical protein